MSLTAEGKAGAATALLRAAGRPPGGAYQLPFFEFARHIAAWDLPTGAAETPALPRLHRRHRQTHHFRHEGRGEDACLLLADRRYFEAFGEGYLHAYGAANPGALVHLYALDAGLDQAALARLEGECGLRINQSIDTVGFTRMTPEFGRGYCVTARYLIAADLLNRYGRVYINDVDGIVGGALPERGYDVWLSGVIPNETAERPLPALWQCVTGGSTLIAATPGGRLFANHLTAFLARRLVHCRQSGERLFFADQAGLTMAAFSLGGRVSMGAMPPIFQQGANRRQGQTRFEAKRQYQKARAVSDAGPSEQASSG